MSVLKNIAIFVFSIYGFLIFLILMLLLMPFFLVAFMLPRPADGNMVFKISYVWASLFFILIGVIYKPVYKWKPEKGQSYIFVTNHISYMDIPMMILITKNFPVRILAKAEMGKIPIFGSIYKTGAVTVQRDNPENRRESIRKLKKLLKRKISILICPEGTFNMTGKPLKEFYDGAFRIAIELEMPVLPVIFPDTYNRLNYHSIFSLKPGKSRAVFLPPVTTDGLTKEDVPVLKAQVYSLMEQEILNLQPSWLDNT